MSKVENPNQKRFQINPIEVLIASALGVVFVHSLYQLLYETPSGPTSTALVAMKAKPTSEGRSIASSITSPTLLNLELDCSKSIESVTQATKARIQGELCGIKPSLEGGKLNSASVTNTSNQFVATVFAQNDSTHFSTDYVPLMPGQNKIHVEFSYSGGIKTYSQDLIITKN